MAALEDDEPKFMREALPDANRVHDWVTENCGMETRNLSLHEMVG